MSKTSVNSYDQSHLTASQQAGIQAAKDAWNAATARGDSAAAAAAHAQAEAIRNSAGYTSDSEGRYSGTYTGGDTVAGTARATSVITGGTSGDEHAAQVAQRQLAAQQAQYQQQYQQQLAAQQAQYQQQVSALEQQLAAQQEQYRQQSSALQEQLLSQQNAYAKILDEQKSAQRAAVQKAVNGLEAQKTATNDTYNQYFRQAYIDKMNAQKNIDQRLAAQGLTGGAAESTLLGLNTSYADALRSMEQGRIRDLEGLDRAISDAQLSGDIEGANAAANTIREQTASYSDTLKYLLDRAATENARQTASYSDALRYLQEQAEARDARQTAYDREDAEDVRAWARQLAMNALSNGYMPDSDTLSAANMSTDYATALLDAINRQRAQERADWAAGYGDYSGLDALGVDTANLSAQQALQLAAMRRQGTTNTSTPSSLVSGDIYARMADAGASDYGTAYDMLRNSGYSVTDANRYASYFAETYLPSRAGTQTAATNGMNESLFNQEARTIMAYMGQGMVSQARNRLARIWDSLSESQQQALNSALANNGYTR